MAKLTQRSNQYETPQITPDQISTPIFGGDAPTHIDVIKSANARAQQRHEMKRQKVADAGFLPDSTEMAGNELVGIKDTGYLAKKGLEYGVNALYNSLPPGMDIEDQELADIRKMELRAYEGGLSYPGDSWSAKRTRGSQLPNTLDWGRPSETNDLGDATLNPNNPSGN